MKQNYRFSILGRTEMPPSSLEAFNCALNYLLTLQVYCTAQRLNTISKYDHTAHCYIIYLDN